MRFASIRKFGVLSMLALAFVAGAEQAKAELGSETTIAVKGRGKYAWAQAQFGGSIFDADDAVPVVRGSVGLQAGRRFGKVGAFVNVDLDQTLKAETGKIRYTQVGAGIEYLVPSGRLRSSASGGLTILGSDHDGRSVGTRGWYTDLRLIAVRWSHGLNVFELTPFAFEITRPLGDDSLTIFDHYLKISYEW